MKLENGKTIVYTSDPTKFDLVVDRWDNAGRKIYHAPYRKFMRKDEGDVYERPVGSGNLWYENNQPAGRIEYKVNEKGHIHDKKFLIGAAHAEYTAPPTPADMHEALVQSQAELEAAKREIAALRKEQSARAEGMKPQDVKTPPTLTKPRGA